MTTLYIIATPIGHLSDITFRAIDILRQVDVIAAEDTRHSKKLLQHYQIHQSLTPYHEHNAQAMTKRLLTLLQEGKSVALISDAGTPLISDPGYLLVKAAHAANIPIVPIPGACAAIAALSVSGLPSDHFIFEGFLPTKTAARVQHLQMLAQETRTLIFYEAPHRLIDTLKDLCDTFGDTREVCLAKELTKLFETVRKTTLKTLYEWLCATPDAVKGEMVLIVAGITPDELQTQRQTQALSTLKMLLSQLPLKKAVQITVELTGVAKNTLYKQALAWEKQK